MVLRANEKISAAFPVEAHYPEVPDALTQRSRECGGMGQASRSREI